MLQKVCKVCVETIRVIARDCCSHTCPLPNPCLLFKFLHAPLTVSFWWINPGGCLVYSLGSSIKYINDSIVTANWLLRLPTFTFLSFVFAFPVKPKSTKKQYATLEPRMRITLEIFLISPNFTKNSPAPFSPLDPSIARHPFSTVHRGRAVSSIQRTWRRPFAS